MMTVLLSHLISKGHTVLLAKALSWKPPLNFVSTLSSRCFFRVAAVQSTPILVYDLCNLFLSALNVVVL